MTSPENRRGCGHEVLVKTTSFEPKAIKLRVVEPNAFVALRTGEGARVCVINLGHFTKLEGNFCLELRENADLLIRVSAHP